MAEVGTIQGASCMLAVESSFGSVDATDARSLDTTTIAGLTAYPMRILRSAFNAAAGSTKQRTQDLQEIAVRGGLPPLVVESPIQTSYPVKQVSGDVTLEFELRGNFLPTTSGLGALLRSCLDVVARSAATVDTATYASANTFTVADDTLYLAGDVIACVQTTGTLRFVRVTDVNAGTNTITTLEAHGLTTGTWVVRFCHLYYPAPDGVPAGDTMIVQLAPRDAAFTYLLVGARVSKIAIRDNGERSKVMAVTLTCPDGIYHTAAIIPVAAKMLPLGVTGTTPLRALVAPCLISGDCAAEAVPYESTAATFPIRGWSVDINITLEPIPDQGTRSGLSGLSVTTAALTASVTQPSPSSGVDFREVLRQTERRAVGLALAGDDTTGNGMCVWIGSADPSDDPGITFEDQRRTQAVSIRAGDYAGDTAGAAHANAPWCIAVVS